MATSDNVIRAGLTPKLRDVPNLVAGLTYISSDHRKHLVAPAPFSGSSKTTLYNPPIPEFSVLRVVLSSGDSEEHGPIGGPSIGIVTGGSGRVRWGEEWLSVSEGDVFFVGADTSLRLEEQGGEGFTLYRAYVEVTQV